MKASGVLANVLLLDLDCGHTDVSSGMSKFLLWMLYFLKSHKEYNQYLSCQQMRCASEKKNK